MRHWLHVLLLVARRRGRRSPRRTRPGPAPRETDLDRFMAAVLARRDDNWKKLQQYILDERERVHGHSARAARGCYGLVHDYRWFVKDGYFIRSPLAANGVTVGDDERRHVRGARGWSAQKARDAAAGRTRARESQRPASRPPPSPSRRSKALGDVLRQQSEPSFVPAAYFLRSSSRPAATRWPARRCSTGARCCASSTTRRACSTTSRREDPRRAPRRAGQRPRAIATTTTSTRSASSSR